MTLWRVVVTVYGMEYVI